MLIQKRGLSKFKWFLKKASTDIQLGDALAFDGLGYVTRATSSSTTIIGASKRAVVSTDSDYASNTSIPVQTFGSDDEIEIDASTTVTQAMVGTQRDLSNSSTLNVGALGTNNIFRVIGIGSTTSKAVVSVVKSSITD